MHRCFLFEETVENWVPLIRGGSGQSLCFAHPLLNKGGHQACFCRSSFGSKFLLFFWSSYLHMHIPGARLTGLGWGLARLDWGLVATITDTDRVSSGWFRFSSKSLIWSSNSSGLSLSLNVSYRSSMKISGDICSCSLNPSPPPTLSGSRGARWRFCFCLLLANQTLTCRANLRWKDFGGSPHLCQIQSALPGRASLDRSA